MQSKLRAGAAALLVIVTTVLAGCSSSSTGPAFLGTWSGGNNGAHEVRFSEGGRLTINGTCSGPYTVLSSDGDSFDIQSGEIDCAPLMTGTLTATLTVSGDSMSVTGTVINGQWSRGGGGITDGTPSPTNPHTPSLNAATELVQQFVTRISTMSAGTDVPGEIAWLNANSSAVLAAKAASDLSQAIKYYKAHPDTTVTITIKAATTALTSSGDVETQIAFDQTETIRGTKVLRKQSMLVTCKVSGDRWVVSKIEIL